MPSTGSGTRSASFERSRNRLATQSTAATQPPQPAAGKAASAAKGEEERHDGDDEGEEQAGTEQPYGKANQAAGSHAPQHIAEHGTHEAADHDGSNEKHGEIFVEGTAARGLLVGRRQGFAFDEANQALDAGVEAARNVAFAEARDHDFLNHALGDRVRDHAFQAIADLDAHLAVLRRHEHEDAVVGYAGLSVVDDQESWVQNIAVRRDTQRHGLGRRLLEALLAEAARRGTGKTLLEVAVDNAPAQRLYASYDFEPVGIRRGYYQPSNTDALVMMRDA